MHPRTRAVVLLVLPAAILTVLAATPTRAQVSVPGNCNVFGAGHASAPGPGGSGGGLLPIEVAVPAGTNRTVTFSLSGTIDYGGCCPSNGPDGVAFTSIEANPLWDGIAGLDFSTRARYLAGVFLDDTEPVDPPPARLVITDPGFTELSPGLRQVFFVGDGLTGEGAGTTQVFHVPDGATRLFLGVQDRCSTSPNVPGWYSDNTGNVSGTVSFNVPTAAGAVPSPFTLLQNHPNPFGVSTAIGLSTRAASQLTLEVFDVRGRKVRTLFTGYRDAGEHSFQWDGTDADGRRVSAGVYYYRLQTTESVSVRKMVLLR